MSSHPLSVFFLHYFEALTKWGLGEWTILFEPDTQLISQWTILYNI